MSQELHTSTYNFQPYNDVCASQISSISPHIIFMPQEPNHSACSLPLPQSSLAGGRPSQSSEWGTPPVNAATSHLEHVDNYVEFTFSGARVGFQVDASFSGLMLRCAVGLVNVCHMLLVLPRLHGGSEVTTVLR
jgi:hypothetical protein